MRTFTQFVVLAVMLVPVGWAGEGPVLRKSSAAAAVAVAAPPRPAAPGEIIMSDEFDGKLGLPWEIIHPKPSHYSLSQKPGHLTITTQRGRFRDGEKEFKNLFLVDCPAPQEGKVLQYTVVLGGFKPTANYQQAGLAFWNAYGDYFIWNLEFLKSGSFDGPALIFLAGPGRGYPNAYTVKFSDPPDKVWLRVTQDENRYLLEASRDGKAFRIYHAFTRKEKLFPKVGVYAQNGATDAPETPASIDSFRVERVAAAGMIDRLEHYRGGPRVGPEGWMGTPSGVAIPAYLSGSGYSGRIAGTVLTPQGKPAAGAELLLWEKAIPLNDSNTTQGQTLTPWDVYAHAGQHLKTDDAGKFFARITSPHFNIAVRHESGAAVANEQFRETGGAITLQPWARVEGTLLSGRQPVAGRAVTIMIMTPHPDPALNGQDAFYQNAPSYCQYVTFTDARGHFALEQVLPPFKAPPLKIIGPGRSTFGAVRATLLAGKLAQSQSGPPRYGAPQSEPPKFSPIQEFQLEPGKTATVTLNFKGREITGRLVALDENGKTKAVDWMNTKVLVQRRRSQPNETLFLTGEVKPDGSFVVPTEAAGEHAAIVVTQAGPGGRRIVAEYDESTVARQFNVAPFNPKDDAPLNLGTWELKPAKPRPRETPGPMPQANSSGPLAVGQEAPDFTFKDLNGKEHKLSDSRCKVVLLDFWATWCGPCREETPALKEVWTAFGKDPRFVMISLSLDPEADAPRDYTRKNGMNWIQGYLGEYKQTQTPKLYGVKSIPSIFVIDAQGRIAANGLRGSAIRAAVAGALGKMGQ